MKKELALLMVGILLIVSGCTGGSTRPTLNVNYNYRQGPKGVEIMLADNAPPDMLYEQTDFLIGVDVSNEGAYNVKGGFLSLGIEDDYMKMIDWNGWIVTSSNRQEKTISFDIRGKSIDNPEGEKSRVTVRAKTLSVGEQAETHTSLVLLTVCYPYGTLLSQEVCIDPDVFSTRKVKKVCEVQPISLSSQGAPVAVTRIEPVMLVGDDERVRPQFTIYVRNVGNGRVFDFNSVQDACSSASLNKENINYVDVTAKLADRQLECKPKPIHLGIGENMVRCSYEGGYDKGSATFISPLIIEIRYAYAFTVSKNVVIRKLPK